jgi:hypothetical protein
MQSAAEHTTSDAFRTGVSLTILHVRGEALIED